MKYVFIVLPLILSQTALANPLRDRKVISVFNEAPAVKAELVRLQAKKIGEPVAFELAGMGDACDFMADYLVIQKIKGNRFSQKTISARISVTEVFFKECGENKPNEITAKLESIIDLNQTTQVNP